VTGWTPVEADAGMCEVVRPACGDGPVPELLNGAPVRDEPLTVTGLCHVAMCALTQRDEPRDDCS